MTPPPGRPARVAVVGAGITGLAVAHRLLEAGGEAAPDVVVLEAGGRAGGKLRTIEVGGVPVEAGADSFVVRKPWAVALARRLGLEDQVVIPATSSAFVLARGRLVPFPARSAFGVPSTVRDVIRWPGLPVRARIRAASDALLPARGPEGDESIGSLATRRLGSAAARTLVGPLLAGIHAGDPDRLSVQATFPELQAWERRHGSLIRGARASLKGPAKGAETAPGPMFASVWGGLSGFVEALHQAVGVDRVRLDTPVASIDRVTAGYVVETGGGSVEADAVVLATPAFESARLLYTLSPAAAADLSGIGYSSTAVVALVYPRGTAGELPEGAGYIVPLDAGMTITACTWVSRKWPREEYGDRAVVRCFVGRAGREEPLDLSDDELIDRVRREVEAVTPLGAGPEVLRVVRWTRAMPQYEVGHLDRLDRIEDALGAVPGVFVTGSAYWGVGIADCVRQAEETARRVLAHVSGGQREREQEAAEWTT